MAYPIRSVTPDRYEPVRVAIVCEQPLIGGGLHAALSKDDRLLLLPGVVCDRASVRSLRRQRPAVTLVDLPRIDDEAVDFVRYVVDTLPGSRVLVLAETDDDRAVARVLDAGAVGQVTYRAGVSRLTEYLVRVAAGGVALSEQRLTGLVRTLVEERRRQPPTVVQFLTRRERQVLVQLADGRSTRDIAEELAISVNTVRSHTQSILDKLGAHSKLEAAAYAARHGLT